MQTTAIGSLEYKNDFFSIVIRESEHRPGSYIFSSGLSLPRFNPIIWGRTGICSNAAFKGLQQLRADVSYFALQRGIVTKKADTPFGSTGGSRGWVVSGKCPPDRGRVSRGCPGDPRVQRTRPRPDGAECLPIGCQGPGRIPGPRSNAALPRIGGHLQLPGSGPIADLETEPERQ